jgi:hypothetical protein
MKKREWGNLGLHIGVGGALTALVMWHVLFINLAVFIYAWLREQAQHLYDYETEWFPGGSCKLHRVPVGFFGWMTWHRMFEVFQWVIGSAVVSIPWYFFG